MKRGRKVFRYTPFLAIILVGLIFRLWNINFGLPHSFYADEPEIAEPAIKYTYEIRSILANNDVYKLVPVSYVYGTVPVYFFTVATMVFSKTMGILSIEFGKADLYIFMRSLGALISLALIPSALFLLNSLGKFIKNGRDKSFAFLFLTFLVAFNWKLIVHAHYLNHDILLTILLSISSVFFLKYLKYEQNTADRERESKNTLASAIFFGLAVGTKITSVITLPIFIFYFLKHKAYRNLVVFMFVIFGVFAVTNPFSIVFGSDFAYRIMQMRQKEAGLVFDSYDPNPLKYIDASSYMTTAPIFLLAIVFIYTTFKKRRDSEEFYFLFAQVLIYVLFYSLQSRRVDRWILPVLPIYLVFATLGLIQVLETIKQKNLKTGFKIAVVFTGLIAIQYLYYPMVLLKQFQPDTPKSAAYKWASQNLDPLSFKYAITEEGLDPLNKLPYSKVQRFIPYTANEAHLNFPEPVELYDYIILSSRPMEYWKKPIIAKLYPVYYQKWSDFEDTVGRMKVVKEFDIKGPNLIPLSSVVIYENPAGPNNIKVPKN